VLTNGSWLVLMEEEVVVMVLSQLKLAIFTAPGANELSGGCVLDLLPVVPVRMRTT